MTTNVQVFKKLAHALVLMCFALSTNLQAKAIDQELSATFVKYKREMLRPGSDKTLVAQSMQNELATLKSQGLTDAELIQVLKTQILDEKAAQEIDQSVASLQGQKMTSEEMNALAQNFLATNSAQGASWIGVVVHPNALWTLLAVSAILSIIIVVSPGCVYEYRYDYYGNPYYNCWYY